MFVCVCYSKASLAGPFSFHMILHHVDTWYKQGILRTISTPRRPTPQDPSVLLTEHRPDSSLPESVSLMQTLTKSSHFLTVSKLSREWALWSGCVGSTAGWIVVVDSKVWRVELSSPSKSPLWQTVGEN